MASLSLDERARLQQLRLTDPAADASLGQLERILASQKFARVKKKTKDILDFIVAKKLLGEADQIKETTIAIFVYQESSDFNPTENSKVRVAVGELRQRLTDYYAVEGHDDPIEILIPLETYVPEARDRRAFVDVYPVENWHPQRHQNDLCSIISDAITYWLNQAEWVRAARVLDPEPRETRATYGFRSSLETAGGALRLNASLGHLGTGRIVCSRTFRGQLDEAFKMAREVGVVLLQSLRGDIHDQYVAAVKHRNRAE